MQAAVKSVTMDPFDRLRIAFQKFNDEQMRALVDSIEETMNQSEAALPSSSAMNQSEATLPTTSSINQSEPTLPTTSGPLGKKNNKHIKQKTLGKFQCYKCIMMKFNI